MASEPTLQDVLIAIARLESKQDAMMEKLDKLEKTSDTHWKKISEIETKIALLEERQGPRIHWVTWAIGVIAILGFVAAFVNYIVL